MKSTLQNDVKYEGAQVDTFIEPLNFDNPSIKLLNRDYLEKFLVQILPQNKIDVQTEKPSDVELEAVKLIKAMLADDKRIKPAWKPKLMGVQQGQSPISGARKSIVAERLTADQIALLQ